MVGHCRDTLRLGTAGILNCSIGHCRILRLGTVGLCGWAQQGYFAVGRCKGTQRLGTAGILCGWSGIAGILGG